MAIEHYVIVGNGAAGNRAAEVIRDGDPEARITLISDEFFPFYYRHLLAYYVTGEKEESELAVYPASHYRDRRIRLRLGQTVCRVDFKEKTLFLKHMEKVHYTRLLLCIGSKPRVPEVHFSYSRHFTVMKTLAHARCLREKLDSVRNVLIAGGDLVSLRLAKAFLKKKIEVYFLIDEGSFWPLELTPDRRAELAESLSKVGIEVLPEDDLAGVEPTASGGYDVTTHKGKKLSCDMVGGFFGLVPDVDFLHGSGVDIDRGILVSESLETSVPHVYAAGDCAQVYNPEIRNYWVSIGWPNAERLGEVAGKNILGADVEAGEPPASALTYEGIKVNTSWWRDL
jgi:nitrite reductase (NADH) large subunit